MDDNDSIFPLYQYDFLEDSEEEREVTYRREETGEEINRQERAKKKNDHFEGDEQLIEEIRNFPVLFDLTSKSYKNLKEKDNAWEEVAAKCQSRVGQFYPTH